MKKTSILLCCSLFFVEALTAQINFSNQTTLLSTATNKTSIAVAVCDMNGDGFDDIVRLDEGIDLNIQYQSAPNQVFLSSNTITLPGQDAWGMCTADVDNDGLGDVLAGGFYDGIKIVRSNPALPAGFSIQNLTSPTTFVQCVNFADINNDGWLDAFVCHDDGISRIFGNNGNGTFTHQPNWIDLKTTPISDNSGNYGSVWTDVNNDGLLDLYIAHCRQGVDDPNDPRRINQLFLNNGDGTYTQDIANTSGLRIGAQSWTADFGDIDNDGDFDCFITNHDVSSQLLENDGSGHFTDITVASGLLNAVGGFPLQGIFRDFDNDGFVDILVGGTTHYLFKNNGDKTFDVVPNLFDAAQIQTFAVGDLNSDGFQDIYAGYASGFGSSTATDLLWMNEGNNNHFYGLYLIGQQSNRNGVGAKVQLHSELGIQTREVRSGESYGISNSLLIHFGMGQITQIDSVVVNWPSGVRDVLYQPSVDEYFTLEEGGCTAPAVSLITNGPTTFCSGQQVELGTELNFDHYTWSTGDTSTTLIASASGLYNVTITTSEGCTAVSASILVTVDPIQIPDVAVLGDTTFCSGESVVLQSSAANGYLWSTGETTQSITVNQAGNYTVAAQGLCNVFSSIPIQIEVLDAPVPSVETDTIYSGESATLVAIGEKITWFDAPNGTNVLGTTDTLQTPLLTENTTYWVANTVSYGLPSQFVGMVNHQGSATSENNYNGGLIFDCFSPFILAKTKVTTTKAGQRKIELRDVNDNVLQSKIVNIPAGTSIIDLDFEVAIGSDLLLTTDGAFNQSSIGSFGPQLYRSTQDVEYPYALPDLVTITASTLNPNRYYYFYDWEISFKRTVCASERVPVTVVVVENSSTTLPSWASGLRIYPNPTDGLISIEIQGITSNILISVKSAQGQTLQTHHVDAAASQITFSHDLSKLPSGIYWIELSSEEGTVSRKIVVH